MQLHVQNGVFSVAVRQLIEISNFFFNSFYPIINLVLYPFLPYRRAHMHLAPLLATQPLPSIPFSQPPAPTLQEYQLNVDTWPFIEATVRDLILHLPQATRKSQGLVLEIGKGIVFTHKAKDASIPLGSFICRNCSWGELMRSVWSGEQDDDVWHNPTFQCIDSSDDTPLFPRFVVELWNTYIYTNHTQDLIAHNLAFTIHFRPKVVLPAELVSKLSDYPSESHLCNYPPALDAQHIPNTLGLPLEVSLTTANFHLRLSQSHYRDLLGFFFLNLGEQPTVCCHSCFPVCRYCGWSHDPGLLCDDCWCVLKVVAEEVKARFYSDVGPNPTKVGQLRTDVLHFDSFLLNTSTRIVLSLPTLFIADTINTVLFPQNGSSYHTRIPTDPEYPLTTPMLLLVDEETVKGRNLQLRLAHWLVNIRPLFFLTLYNWVCDPVWETADWPEAADWPKKVGNYDVHLTKCRAVVSNSTQLPEPSHPAYPARLTLFGCFTNMNRPCLLLGVETNIHCVMDAAANSIQCDVQSRCDSLVGTIIRAVFATPPNPTHFCIDASYACAPCNESATAFDTTIAVKLSEFSLAIRLQDVPLFTSILSFQFKNTNKYLFASAARIPEKDSVIVTPFLSLNG